MMVAVEEPAGRKLTPMLRQYNEAKQTCPDAILMFRMGDFFELFFEDAKIAARELGITLTARDKGDDPIPMAGVPHHAVGSYIARLVDSGYTVALCDQVEDPRKVKGLVKREITRLITPGTVADLEALDPNVANYLACGQWIQDTWAVAFLDLLSGDLLCTRARPDTLGDELQRMGVRELLVEEKERPTMMSLLHGGQRIAVRALTNSPFTDAEARELLWERFGCDVIVGAADGGIAAERQALCQVVAFAESTQRRPLMHLVPPRAYQIDDFLVVDEATRRNLELCHSQPEGRRRGSLLWHLDRCKTAVGSRTLAQWLLFPLRNMQKISARQDDVQRLMQERSARAELQQVLGQVRDIERLMGRVAVARANPRDLAALRDSLQQLPVIKNLLMAQTGMLGERAARMDARGEVADLAALLQSALVSEPPVACLEGGIFARGYIADLDELIDLSQQGHQFLSELERRERERTGIGSLKVRYTKVFGYYLEVTRANLQQVPTDYIRKQTLVGAERFITAELKDFEEKVLHADERRREREAQLYSELLQDVAKVSGPLRAVSRLLGDADALASLAQVADEGRYSRPEMRQEPILMLEEARHAVLERLMPGGERFVPNDIRLDCQRKVLIVTGPNMAGKSTAMRQAALCTLMAHMGSFVPARVAHIGLCDRLFTRVGASDNLGRGQSTFMVEMSETSTILAYATSASLVLLDEVGRGTSTFDGVSLAWAVAEFLHNQVGCRTLFATHYHELTRLSERHAHIANVSMAVQEEANRVVFLRRLVEGPANRSYGIEVARLAGLPELVLQRAREILATLERGGKARAVQGTGERQLSLFMPEPHNSLGAAPAALPPVATPAPSIVEEALAKLDPMALTPLQAITALAKLKEMLSPCPVAVLKDRHVS